MVRSPVLREATLFEFSLVFIAESVKELERESTREFR
jgi:hypothetical protein